LKYGGWVRHSRISNEFTNSPEGFTPENVIPNSWLLEWQYNRPFRPSFAWYVSAGAGISRYRLAFNIPANWYGNTVYGDLFFRSSGLFTAMSCVGLRYTTNPKRRIYGTLSVGAGVIGLHQKPTVESSADHYGLVFPNFENNGAVRYSYEAGVPVLPVARTGISFNLSLTKRLKLQLSYDLALTKGNAMTTKYDFYRTEDGSVRLSGTARHAFPLLLAQLGVVWRLKEK